MTIPLHHAAILQAKAYRILRQDVGLILEPEQLSMHEWVVLSLLEERKSMTTSALAEELGVELPMITLLTNSLEERKLIERKPYFQNP